MWLFAAQPAPFYVYYKGTRLAEGKLVFLSYAREDAAFAKRLYADLKRAGVNLGLTWKTYCRGRIGRGRSRRLSGRATTFSLFCPLGRFQSAAMCRGN